jgi:D-alanyl-D-alanine carboxypeptidase
MLSRIILISLLMTLPVLYSCQDQDSASSSHKGLAVAAREAPAPGYDSILQAFHLLQKDPLLENASLGYMVVDVTAKDPVVIADYHSKDLMIPASTLKIFVTAAALEYFGKPVIPEVMVTNQMSVNWRSSKLLRKIGGKVYNTPTTAAGAKAILDFWTTKGVDTEGMNFYDGNGLSRNNAISPKQLVDALYVMRTSPYYQVFYESLPLAGLTGTLHKAMRGSAAEGRVHAKTGTIGKVKSFAGYVSTVTGKKLIFSLIVNNFDCRVKLMKKKLEAVMITMAEM